MDASGNKAPINTTQLSLLAPFLLSRVLATMAWVTVFKLFFSYDEKTWLTTEAEEKGTLKFQTRCKTILVRPASALACEGLKR